MVMQPAFAHLLCAEVKAYEVPLWCFFLFHPDTGWSFSLRAHSGTIHQLLSESSFLADEWSRWHFGWAPSLHQHQQLAASCPGSPADTGGASTSRLRGPASRVLTGIPAYDSSYPPLWQLECGRNTIWPHPVCYSLLSQPYLHQAGLAGTKPERKAPAEA